MTSSDNKFAKQKCAPYEDIDLDLDHYKFQGKKRAPYMHTEATGIRKESVGVKLLNLI